MHLGVWLRLLCLAALCSAPGALEAPAEDAAWSTSSELQRLSPALAGLLAVPCGSSAHIFREERESSREVLAALRIARGECQTRLGGVSCGFDGEEGSWQQRVGALQSLLHRLCQQTAVEASLGDGHARGVAARLVTSAVHAEADRESKLFNHRGERQAPAGSKQYPPLLLQSSSCAAAQPLPPPPPPGDPHLPAAQPWWDLGSSGWGELAASREGGGVAGVALTERRALLELHKAAGGAAWVPQAVASWGSEATHCAWAGVTCGASTAGVVALRLPAWGLAGTLPPALQALRALQVLELSGNGDLRGFIPRGLFNLPRLRALALRGCRLGGPLPGDIANASALEWLDLSANQLSGELPAALGNLHALRLLNLSHNALESGVPQALAGLKALEVLSLAANRLQGTLPPSLLCHVDGPPKLRLFDVAWNHRLQGSVPACVSAHASLAVFDVSHNDLRGPLPAPPPSARVWACAGNAFTGQLPEPALRRARGLRHLDLSDNQLSGEIPAHALLLLAHLRLLNLSSNALRGALPGGSGDQAVDAEAHEAMLAGAWAPLEVLDVAHNALTGSLSPSLFGAGRALSHLDVRGNSLGGAFPGDALAGLTQLQHLDVGRNVMSGSLSAALGSAQRLTWFKAEGNRLRGRVPLKLTTLPALQHLDLSGMELTWEFV